MRFTRSYRHILAVGLGSLAVASPAFAHGDARANLGVLNPSGAQTTQVGPNADQRGPGIATASRSVQVGPNADQRGPGVDPASSSTALPASAPASDDSGVSVLALVLSLAGIGVVAAGGAFAVSARGRGHRAGTA